MIDDRIAYAQYEDFNTFSYKCIKYLMDNNEVIWKLLKYDTSDAWNRANLTKVEKSALVYNGSDDSTLFRVFMDMGQPDVHTREDTIIRIAPYSIFPENRTVGTLTMIFEVYCHYHINTLSNYTTRVDTIAMEFLKTFNGINIGGIGKLFFNRMGSQAPKMELSGQIPHKGKFILMSNKVV